MKNHRYLILLYLSFLSIVHISQRVLGSTMCCYYFIVAVYIVALFQFGHCSVESEWQHTILINAFNGTRNDTCYDSGSGQITCEDINAGFRFRNSSTEFVLRPGMHYLSDPVPFSSVNQIAIIGDNGSMSTVVCGEGTGFSFINSTSITLQWVTYLACGVLQNSTSKNFSSDASGQSGHLRLQVFLVGFYFYQCRDVVLEYMTIADSSANGLVMYDTVGNVVVMNSIFYNNSVPSNQNHTSTHSGGGGVSVEFSFCKPGDEKCSTTGDHFQIGNNSDSTYIFRNCTFAKNIANIAEKYMWLSGFIKPYLSYHEALGRGGGLSLYFKGNATNNTVTIVNCTFRHNHAVWGGGLIVNFEDNSVGNLVNIDSCHFEENHCYYALSYGTGGGAIRISMYNYFGGSTAPHWNGNQVLIYTSTFENNRALDGGAISIQGALQYETPDKQITRVRMNNCNFVNNSGRLGSAVNVQLLPVVSEGKMPQVVIANCVFTSNTVKYTDATLYNTGIGAVYVTEIPVTFLSFVHFESNIGTALAAYNSQLNFGNCRAIFQSNIGIDGGAIALLAAAYLLINDSTDMTFINNTADHRGGAIFNLYVSKNSMKTYIACFLRYDTPFISDWKSRFTFNNNNATQGKSIFSTSILPCAWKFGSGIIQDVKRILCWDEEHWNYSGQNCSDEIYTEASHFSHIRSPIQVVPGQQFSLPITVQDDLSHNITKQVVYQASIQNSSVARVDPKFAYVANSEMAITGLNQSESDNVVLKLDTAGSTVWHIDVNVQILMCPPGLSPVTLNGTAWNTICKCSGTYGGHLKCAVTANSYKVDVRNGFWIGNVSGLMLMGECQRHCRIDIKENYYRIPKNISVKDLDSYVCGVNNRTGILCGKCLENYGPAVNSWSFRCVACNDSDIAKRIVKYFFTTYVPLFFMFLAVILSKVQLTTGPANAFLLYAQMISTVFEVNAGGVIALNSAFSPRTIDWLEDVYYFVYGIFNLDFLSYLLNRYCLTQKLNTLDVLQLQYCVAIFPLLMIIAVVVALKLKEQCFGRCFGKCLSRCTQRFQNQRTDTQEEGRERSGWRFTDNLLHAFVAFTLLSYTKFGTSSAFILSATALFDKDGNSFGARRLYNAGQYSIDYKGYVYGYGLLAGVVFAVFVTLPPLMLLGPLNWFNQLFVPRVSLLRRYWPSDKVNIVLDSFQGCYKPHARFFAGLYFLFRMAIFINYAFTTSFFQTYAIQQILATIMVALVAIFQPYRRQLFNYVDILIFLNMAILNSLSIYIFISSETNPQAPFPVAVFIILYILVYLPLVYIIGYLLYSFFKSDYRKRIARYLKLQYTKCCCHNKDPSLQPLLDPASGNIQSSNYKGLADDASLFVRAKEANTFRPSPSIRRAVGLSVDDATGVTHITEDDHEDGSSKSKRSSQDVDSGLRSRSDSITPTSTQSTGIAHDSLPNGDDDCSAS